jgi:hypothetical protein
MAAKRTINFTAPDGTPLCVNVGPKRQVSALRVLDYRGFDPTAEGVNRWMISIHGTVTAAIKGPNQTPSWNVLPRHVLLIEEGDQPSRDGWYTPPR